MELNRRTLEQRAITAAIWGMPIVSVKAMRQAFFRDAKANYNDIVFWSKPSDWKNRALWSNGAVMERVPSAPLLPDTQEQYHRCRLWQAGTRNELTQSSQLASR